MKKTKMGQRTNCHIIFRGFELPKGDVDGDTALALGLELVEDPCVLEGTLSELGSFLYQISKWVSCNDAPSVVSQEIGRAHV